MPPPAEGFVTRLLLGPALGAQPDGRLVKLVREGYEAAFDEIVRRYGGSLRRYAAAIAGGSAEDVTQDALSKAFVALRRDDREIELRPWLYRILRNTALNDLRDRPPRTAELGDSIEGPRGVAEEVERREEIGELTRRLHALPEPQRAAIVMRELEGLGHEEIATALGISGGAARQAIHRARTALRDGFGMAIPLPLLKLMLGGGSPAAEVAAGGAGAGVALKAATATVLVAGTLGAGIALHDGVRGGQSASASASGGGTGSARQNAGSRQLAVTSSASRGSAGAHDEGRHGDSSGGSDGTTRTAGGESRHEGGDQGRSGQHEGAGDGPAGSQPNHDGPDSGGSSNGERSGSGDNTLSGGSGGSGSDGSGSGDGMDGGVSGGEQVSGPENGSGSNSGPDSGGGEEPSTSGSGDSRDSGDGEGFSGQVQLQTQEER